MDMGKLRDFFPDSTPKDMTELIFKILAEWRERNMEKAKIRRGREERRVIKRIVYSPLLCDKSGEYKMRSYLTKYEIEEKFDSLEGKRQSKDNFLKAVRSFMEMKTLNPVILRELVEKIEVYQIEGTGKNRTQRVIIHYRFVGCLQIPEWHRKRKVILESRQGVEVNYLLTTA